jgi:hypothetical protein
MTIPTYRYEESVAAAHGPECLCDTCLEILTRPSSASPEPSEASPSSAPLVQARNEDGEATHWENSQGPESMLDAPNGYTSTGSPIRKPVPSLEESAKLLAERGFDIELPSERAVKSGKLDELLARYNFPVPHDEGD